MSQFITSNKSKFNIAKQFKESFSEPEPATLAYIFIGNHLPYANSDTTITNISDTLLDEKSVWDNMIAAKKITGNDVQFVIENREWITGRIYRQYDDTVDRDELLTEDNSLYPMYIVNNDREVFLCVDNNNSSMSTVEPFYSTSDVVQTVDNYVWKYLYTIPNNSKFANIDWIPVPSSIEQIEYYPGTPIDGQILSVIVTNSGNNYINTSNNKVLAFAKDATVLTVTESEYFANANVGMQISGTGILPFTYITNKENSNSTITLSTATSGSGGGVGNNISFITRAIFEGDGELASANVVLNVGNHIESIDINDYNSQNYSNSTIKIYGTGSDASARAILPPKFGHGFNFAKELGCSRVMISLSLQFDDEIPQDISYRQTGILIDPYKFDSQNVSTVVTSNTIIQQTTNITILGGDSYLPNEFVYQGNIDAPDFSGYVCYQTSNKICLTGVRGNLIIGKFIKGTETNPNGRIAFLSESPYFKLYTGDILYVGNHPKITRTENQSEQIKLIVSF